MKRRAIVWVCLAFAAGVSGVGCASASPAEEARPTTSKDGGGGASGGDAGGGSDAAPVVTAITMLPEAVFSGFDGVHTFQVPVGVYGAKGAVLTASDPSKVTIARATIVNPKEAKADNGEIFMITVKAAGAVKLTAAAGGKTASVDMTITTYPKEQFTAGEARYKNQAASGPACANCHSGDGAIDHSPTSLAAASDGEVQAVITAGILREGNPIKNVNHKWQVSDAELDGLVTYLRALPPRGFSTTP